ncbi:PEP-CTERM sorting domain-containing protein [Massilia sp. UMI-21]|nr:PEP-CTERM sorting domain-containing protein [Massilia sp. UMI-21]
MNVTLRKCFTTAAFAITTMAASAAMATPFVITDTVITPGAGYGQDASENNNPTLLGALFKVTNATQAFSLMNAGDYFEFTFGTVNFNEPNSNGGITANEMDKLGVTTTFTFSQPGVGAQMVTATGTAVLGAVNDPNNGANQTDLTIDWATLSPINFGIGGSFKIDLTDLVFTANGTKNAVARVTLLTAEEAPANDVPEPGSLALAGLGLVAAGIARRRQR